MKSSLLLGIAITAGLASAPLMAQSTAERIMPNLPIKVAPEKGGTQTIGAASNASSMPAPMTLRGGAVATGLSGYYDYQSNGMLRGRLIVSKTDPQKMYTAYMLSLNGSDENTIDPSRRVGYAYSTNGGNTWEATKEIDANFKLGYPYIQVNSAGVPYIAAHGDPDGAGARTMVYTGAANSLSFTRTATFDRQSILGSSGDEGAGVIWPAMVLNPADQTKSVVAATLSYAEGSEAEPVHVTSTSVGASNAWRVIAESDNATSSGGRNIMMVSPGGKIGIVYLHFTSNDTEDGTSGVFLTESTNGGTSWSAPEMIIQRQQITGEDSLYVGANLDFVYNGEDPQVVVSGSTDGSFVSENIYFWNRTEGMKKIAGNDSALGIGVTSVQLTKLQSNMSFVSYPTLSVGDDGRHMVVTFQAAVSVMEEGERANITNDGGFHFYRVWAVGSPDKGATWKTPRILQDFNGDGGAGGDQATIEYALSNDWGRMVNGSFEHWMVYQAKREPGMYASTIDDVSGADGDQPSDRGDINEAFQFFQRTVLDPTFFGEVASVGNNNDASTGMAIERAFPNPATSTFSVDYQLPAAGRVTIKVYNALGDEVLAPVDEAGHAGGYSRNFSVSSLSNGQYRVVVAQNGRTVSHGMTIVR